MNRRPRTTRPSPRGVALLLVLGIIMAITLLSLGFIARCDVELASGQNMAIRLQMDQMAASALEHARGLLLNPQDVAETYWTGASALQLDPNTSDFYDVDVNEVDECTFAVACEAYRLRNGQKIGSSRLSTEVRLDPAIGLWSGADLYVRSGWGVIGDVYAAGTLTNPGLASAIEGDVFATDLDGAIVGTYTNAMPVAWPPVSTAYSHPDYTTTSIGPGVVSGNYASDAIRECIGDLFINGAATLHGMLLVDGDLVIQGSDVQITAAKNLPAIYVTGNLFLHGATNLRIEGLVAVDGHVLVGHGCADLQITGGLFAGGEVVEATPDSSGHANDAILRNISSWAGSGVLALDGEDQYVQTLDNDATLQLTGAYSLSVRLYAQSSQKPWAGILTKTDPTGETNHWVLQFDIDGLKLLVCHATVKWDTGIVLGDLLGGWHQVTIVRQADGMTYSYLDGVLRKTLDLGSFWDVRFKDRAPGSGIGHLNIGADRTAGSTYVLKGSLDDVRVYNRALSAGEVSTLPTDASLIGYWTFDADESQMNVVASPTRSSIAVGPVGSREHWSPAAGAFFKSIRRESE